MVSYSNTEEAKISNGEMTVPSISGAGKTGKIRTKLETGPLPYIIYKINSISIKDLHVRSQAIQLLEDIDGKLFDIKLTNIYLLDMSSQARDIKAK